MSDELKPDLHDIAYTFRNRTCPEHDKKVDFLIEGTKVTIVHPCCDNFKNTINDEFIEAVRINMLDKTSKKITDMLKNVFK